MTTKTAKKKTTKKATPAPKETPRERLSGPMIAFISAYEVSLNVGEASKIAGVNRRRIYEWKEKSPKFVEAMQDAHENGVDRIEREAYRRAVEGVVEKKFGPTGAPIFDPDTALQHVVRSYSDKILLALLRRYKPEHYSNDPAPGFVLGVQNTNSINHASVVQEMQKDPDYLEFLRAKALGSPIHDVPSAPVIGVDNG